MHPILALMIGHGRDSASVLIEPEVQRAIVPLTAAFGGLQPADFLASRHSQPQTYYRIHKETTPRPDIPTNRDRTTVHRPEQHRTRYDRHNTPHHKTR